MKKSLWKLGSAALMAFVLSACGGGGGGSAGPIAGGTGGTGIASGVVTGISSVIVNGVTFSCTGAVVANDDGTVDQGSGDRCVAANGTGLLQPGMVVTINGNINATGTTGNATRVTVRDDLKGPVSNKSTTNNSFTVMNQTVLVDDQTRFEINSVHSTGLTGFANLNDGMIVEVSGLPDGTGKILATFVETKQGLNAGSEFEIKGFVSVSGTTITIGSLTINNSGFASPALVDGQCVELHGTFSGGVLTLTKAPSVDDDCDGLQNNIGKAEAEGIVNGFTSTASEFKVGLQRVTVSTATIYVNGVVDDLSNGAKIEAEGPIANSVLAASKIKFKPGVRIEAKADSAGSGSSVNVLGIAVSTNSRTEFKDVSGISSIAAGDCLRIRGFKSGATGVIAQRIERRGSGSACSEAELRGPVDASSIVSPTAFAILGVPVTTGSSTKYNDSTGTTAQTAFYTKLSTQLFAKAKGTENPDTANAINANVSEGEVENEDD